MEKSTAEKRKKAGLAAFYLAAVLLSGVGAVKSEQAAKHAESEGQAYIAQGNQQQAAEWSAQADSEEQKRNASLGIIVLSMGMGVTMNAAGRAASHDASGAAPIHEAQQPQPVQSTQEEAQS